MKAMKVICHFVFIVYQSMPIAKTIYNHFIYIRKRTLDEDFNIITVKFVCHE